MGIFGKVLELRTFQQAFFLLINPHFQAGLLCSCHQIVSSIALETLSLCGAEFESEHQDDVIERRQFGVDGDVRANHTKPLPAPFSERPRIGTRLYVRKNTRRFLLVGAQPLEHAKYFVQRLQLIGQCAFRKICVLNAVIVCESPSSY